MKYVKLLSIILCTLCILTSCKGQTTAPSSQNNNSSSKSTEESNVELEYKNASSSDVLAFYKNDEKSNKNPTAINVVIKYLEAMKNNDYDAWLSTMTTDKQKGFLANEYHELRVIKLDILNVNYDTDAIYRQRKAESEWAKELGCIADNMAIVCATYDIQNDHREPSVNASSNDGKTEWRFILIREDKDSPWIIADWG